MKLNPNHSVGAAVKILTTQSGICLSRVWCLPNTEIKEEIKRYLETNENENTTIPKSVGHSKSILRGKFIALQAYIKKQEQPQINNLTLHLMEQEKNSKVQLVNWWKSRWILLSPTLRTKMENN